MLVGMMKYAGLAAAVAAAVGLAGSPPAVTGLDHIPIAVRDLDRAAADYRALGFALKPGRPHDDGITNQHVKFPNGTELELITAAEARDELTATYLKHLAAGERGTSSCFQPRGNSCRAAASWAPRCA